MAGDDTPPEDAQDAHAEAAEAMAGDGRVTLDGFDLVEKVASGKSTDVWEALERATGQTHAIKLLNPELIKDRDELGVLKHEAKVGALFAHPNVIRTGGFVKTRANAYVVMELFRNPNLKEAVSKDPAGTRALVQAIVEGLCQGLGHIHEKGWLHLDVKPDNLLIAPDGDARVIDFSLSAKPKGGFAAMLGGKSSVISGTRTYIAPETLLRRAQTPATDVYSLGISLYEMLTGRPPFAGIDPADLLKQHVKTPPPPVAYFNDNLTDELDRFLNRMLAKKPDDRHQSMAEVAADFGRLTVFKEDPEELLAERRRKSEEASLDAASRLDSRADATRTAKGIKPPPKPAPKKRRQSELGEKKKAAAAQQRPAAQPAPQFVPPPGYPPGYPPPGYYPQPQFAPQPYPPQYAAQYGGPPPGQPPQGQYPQGQPPQGQYPQGGPPPGYAAPQQPGPPRQAPPPQAGPPQPAPRPSTPPQPVNPPQAPSGAQVQVPGLTRPSRDQHPSQKRGEDDDLPLMTELPDVV